MDAKKGKIGDIDIARGPQVFHLSIWCKESVLLKFLPDLRGLTLEILSSALSRDFFAILLVKPINDPIAGVEIDRGRILGNYLSFPDSIFLR